MELNTYDMSKHKTDTEKRTIWLWTNLHNTLLYGKGQVQKKWMNAIFVYKKVSKCMFFYIQRVSPDPHSRGAPCEERVTGRRVIFYTFCNFEHCSK